MSPVQNPGIGPTILAPATNVYSGAAPIAYTDLDLSAIVGSTSAIVLLKIKNTDAGGAMTATVRRNGETDLIGGYVSVTGVLNQNIGALVACVTDTAGIIEWDSDAARTCEVDVEAYWHS